MKILNLFEIFENFWIFEIFRNFEIFWNFWNIEFFFLLILEFWNFMKILKFLGNLHSFWRRPKWTGLLWLLPVQYGILSVHYGHYYIVLLFKQLYWLSCCHLTFRKIWYCLIKTRTHAVLVIGLYELLDPTT